MGRFALPAITGPRKKQSLSPLKKCFLLLLAFCPAAVLNPAHAARPIEAVVCGIGLEHPDLEARLKILKEMGVTSVQTYLYWNKIEVQEGRFDWEAIDRFLAVLRKAGLKWVPFVIAGPWYVTPGFAARDPETVMLRCLEHGRDGGAVSIWSLEFRRRLEKYVAALASRYASSSLIESINVGVSGDYGEAIYPVIGNWPGEYHSHPGYWCADGPAADDFRQYFMEKYAGAIQGLNTAWKSAYNSFPELAPFHPDRAPSLRARLELIAWYRGAMTRHAEWWLETVRRFFPAADIYLCTGGDMSPAHGSDFSAQAKAAARHGCCLRVTNEASSYPHNFRLTRLAASACRYYGAYLGLEPAAAVRPAGMVARLFNAVASGARQFFFYYTDDLIPRIQDPPLVGEAGEYFSRSRPLLNVEAPLVDIAVFYPTSGHAAQGLGDFSREAVFFRRAFDYDLVDEGMIADGALAGYPLLVVAGTRVMPGATLEKIALWVEQGGTLFVLDSLPFDEDGDGGPFARLLGILPGSEEIFGIAPLAVEEPGPWPSLSRALPASGTRGWLGLSADVEPLLTLRAPAPARAAWRLPRGKGTVVAYFAPLDWEANGEDWMDSGRLPLLFLQDIWTRLVAEKRLARLPASLNLDRPGLYLATVRGATLLYNAGPAPLHWPGESGDIILPANSITRIDTPPAARQE